MSELVAEYAVAEMPPAVDGAAAVQAGFDYAQIDEGVRDEVRETARKIRAYGESLKGSMIAIGKRLQEVKGMLPHGQFEAWIEAEFSISPRTAQNLMNVAKVYGDRKSETVSLLPDAVLYALAAPSTPDAVRETIEQRAVAGESVTVADVREAKAVVKPPREVKRLRPEPAKPEPVPARAVYVEPTPYPTKQEFAAIEAAVEASITPDVAEKMRASAERSRRVREEVDLPDPSPYGMVAREWVLMTLSKSNPIGANFASALKMVNADDVREAMANLTPTDPQHMARCAALKARLSALEPPTPAEPPRYASDDPALAYNRPFAVTDKLQGTMRPHVEALRRPHIESWLRETDLETVIAAWHAVHESEEQPA